MIHTAHRLPALLTLVYMSVFSVFPVFAQQFEQSTSSQATTVPIQDTTEHIALTVGDILEILPSTDIAAPTYSWILTQQRTFIQAARTQTFRYRFLLPGTYSLIGEIQSADMTTTVNRTFTIIAKAHERGIVDNSTSSVSMETASGTLSGLVMIDPPMDTNKRVILGPNQQLVKFIPMTQDVKPLSLDIDTETDSDKDGNASNDVDNKGTFFQLYSEPLFVWLTNPITDRKISITTVSNDGIAHVQDVDIFGADFAQEQGLIVSPIRFTAEQKENGTYEFTTKFEGSAPTAPLLYHWTFGDGQESLLVNPTHTYGINGAYTVVMQVRNLIDGQDVARTEQQLTVVNAAASMTSEASSSSDASTSSSDIEESTIEESGGLSLTVILSLVGIFLLFIIFGVGITLLLSKFRRGRSLDQTFADLEKNIIPATLSIPATAIPTAAKKTTPDVIKEVISTREENATSSPPIAMTARIDEKAAPGWLKKGLETPTAEKVPASTSGTSAVTTSILSTPSAPVVTPAKTPSWLQTAPAKTPSAQSAEPVASTQSPAATPTPIATPPVKASVPAPTSTTATVPPWLQKAATVSTSENKASTAVQQKPAAPVTPAAQKPAVTSSAPASPQPIQKPAEASVPTPVVSSLPTVKKEVTALPATLTVNPVTLPPLPSSTASITPATPATPSIAPKPLPAIPSVPTVIQTATPAVQATTSAPAMMPKPAIVSPAMPVIPKPTPAAAVPPVTATVSPALQTSPVNPITPKPTVIRENLPSAASNVASNPAPKIPTPAPTPTPMPKVITETPILPAAPQPGIAAPTPIQKPQVSLDEPIAFIRADSLEQPKNTQNDQKS